MKSLSPSSQARETSIEHFMLSFERFVAKTLDPTGVYITGGVYGDPEEKSVEKFLEFQKHGDVPQHLCMIVDDRFDVWKESQREKVQQIDPFFFWIEDPKEEGYPGTYKNALEDDCLMSMRRKLFEKYAKLFPGKA